MGRCSSASKVDSLFGGVYADSREEDTVRKIRVVVAILALLAAVLVVGLTTDAAATSKPGVFHHELAAEASSLTGMSCSVTVDVWRPRLVVATIVCRAVRAEG